MSIISDIILESSTGQEDLKNKIQKVFTDGKLVHLFISKWSMRANLLPHTFGLTDTFVDNVQIRLVETDTRFSTIESQARRYLRHNSFDFPIANAHFVPIKKLYQVLVKLEQYKQEYFQEVNKFLDQYEQIRNDMLNRYPSFRDILLPAYPDVDRLRSKFDFDVTTFEIAFPKKLTKWKVDWETLMEKEAISKDIAKKLEAEYDEKIKQQYAKALERMETFVGDSIRALRSQIIDCFEYITQKIKNKQIISKKNIDTIKTVIDSFNALNFFNDEVVAKQLREISELVTTTSDFKDDKVALERLNLALGNTLNLIANLNDVDDLSGQYFRNFEKCNPGGPTL